MTSPFCLIDVIPKKRFMKQHSYFSTVLLLLPFLLTNCKNNNRDTDLNVAEAKNAIAASNALYFESFEKNDSSIFINSYAEDACIMAPNAPVVCGRGGAA